MTKEEMIKIGEDILDSDLTALQMMIKLKSEMQKTFIEQLTTSESIEMALNVRNQNTIDKLYKLGSQILQTIGDNNKNIYCVGLVIATILKEIFEDTTFVSNDSLYEIISKYYNRMDESFFTVFLGVKESQIDADLLKPFGHTLYKRPKKLLDCNMYMVQYLLSVEQYFELFFDNDRDSIVVNQRTFLPDIKQHYEILRSKSIPYLKVAYSNGFFIKNDIHNKVLFELLSIPNYPTCIMTSI